MYACVCLFVLPAGGLAVFEPVDAVASFVDSGLGEADGLKQKPAIKEHPLAVEAYEAQEVLEAAVVEVISEEAGVAGGAGKFAEAPIEMDSSEAACSGSPADFACIVVATCAAGGSAAPLSLAGT